MGRTVADRRLTATTPTYVFDGHCVLCSRGVAFLMRQHRAAHFRFLSSQSELGQTLFAALGFDPDETYLLIDAAGVHTKSDGWLRVGELLGGPWGFCGWFRLIPRGLRDLFYDFIAGHRYQWFGQVERCAVLTPEQRRQLITEDQGLRRQVRDLFPST